MNDKGINLGLDILNKLPVVQKQRKKNPSAHMYRQKDGSYKFKAIIHEDVDGIKATRQSFKAVISIIPTTIPKKDNGLKTMIFYSILILMLLTIGLSTFYVNDVRISVGIILTQLLMLVGVITLYRKTKNIEGFTKWQE